MGHAAAEATWLWGENRSQNKREQERGKLFGDFKQEFLQTNQLTFQDFAGLQWAHPSSQLSFSQVRMIGKPLPCAIFTQLLKCLPPALFHPFTHTLNQVPER